jgi:hypothetical protein
MKWFILSDIYANLPALEAVFADIEERFGGSLSKEKRSDVRIISLGDQIGYHPYPNEVMDWVWNIADEVLIGNHEKSVFEILNQQSIKKGCTLEAQWAMLWTAEALNSRNRNRLVELCTEQRYMSVIDTLCFTHGRQDDPEKMQYTNTIEDAQTGYLWSNDPTRICFVGHTHEPKIYTCSSGLSGQVSIPRNTVGVQSFDLSDAGKAMVIVPSVGQPRDGFACTGYCIFDTDTWVLYLIRLPYDIQRVQSRMRELNFPRDLVERLPYGD